MIVAVAGGKGGIGKTLLATSLALANAPLQFFDCDVEEPNGHFFLEPRLRKVEQVTIPVPRWRRWKGEVPLAAVQFCRWQALATVNEETLVFPELCTGCGGCFLLSPDGTLEPIDYSVGVVKESGARSGISLIWGELQVGAQQTVEVIRAVKERLDPARDAVIDCPPGSSRPLLESVRGSNCCLLVTEPTPLGLHDLQNNLRLLKLLKIPAGVVINRSGSGYEGTQQWCRQQDLPLLAEIPFDPILARGAARGRTLPDLDSDWVPRLRELWAELKRL